jgi:hypothetical protein
MCWENFKTRAAAEKALKVGLPFQARRGERAFVNVQCDSLKDHHCVAVMIGTSAWC